MSDLLSQLNPKQREAVEKTDGPVLIIAGAGSGKTRALTHRVAYLVKEKKIPPKNILAVTFTNKAAGEMADRVKELLGLPKNIPPYSQYLPHIGTFHAICVKILRREIEKIGYKKSFVIYDDQDQLALMRRICKELKIYPDQIKPQAILGAISSAKNKLVDAKMFQSRAGSWFEELVAKAYEKYQSELKKTDALDFDDIILLTVKLFQKYKDVLGHYQDLFRYIMVDEYQDTNFAQYTLLKLLAQKHHNICVVGDDWQSIYQWRGADVQNILDFEKDYPGAKVVMLEQNYRSTQNILDAAYCVISRNINRKDKKLWTENLAGHLLTSYEASDEKDEAGFVVSEIKKLQKEERLRLDDFAILYRTNAQSRALEEAFMKAAMPYKIIGGVKFYQRKEIKDILAYLFLIQNPADTVSFERIINVPIRGIGDKTTGKVIDFAGKNNLDMLSAIESTGTANELPLQSGKIRTLQQFAKLIRSFQSFSKNHAVTKLISEVYAKSGYETMLLAQKEEGLVRHENIQELLTVAKKYDELKEQGLEQFLEEVALVSQTDRDLESNEATPLMTLHSAKGLEFEIIFIVGMEEGLLPHSRATLNEKEMEEERRLCYVGITRAKKKAYLLFTTARNIYGTTQISIKSRFLDEIDQNLLDFVYAEEQEYTTWIDDEDTIELEDDDFRKSDNNMETIKDGDHVEHPNFGKGVVISQDENLITVAFPGFGLKKLAKSIAPLRKI